MDLKPYLPFSGLLIFGNIENLILASQGAIAHVDPYILGGLSVVAVIIWLLIGTYGTKVAIKFLTEIYFIINMQEYHNFCKLWMNCKLGILLFY